MYIISNYYVIAHFHFVLSRGAVPKLIYEFFHYQVSVFRDTADFLIKNTSDSRT